MRSGNNTPLVRKRPSLDFSMTGLIYCSMMVFMLLAAMNTQANLLFGVFGLMVGILVISAVVSRIVLKKLALRRSLPEHGVVGEPMTVSYEFTNEKRYWPSLSVSLAELDGVAGFASQPQCYLLHTAPKMTAVVPLELVPQRRGLQELDRFQLATSFPFGFIKRARIHHRKDAICIFPALAEVDRRVLAMCRSADNVGQAVRPQSGGADEFYGLREYRPGDSPRQIYWRRSARTGVLVAKEMTRVAPPRLLLLVDTFATEPGALELVERAIAMAASLASAALEQELAVGICAWAGKPLCLTPTRGKQQREEVLSILAQLPVNTTCDSTQLLEHGEWLMKAGTTLIMLSPSDVRPRLPDHARGSLLVLSAASEPARGYFRFRPGVSFAAKSADAPGGKAAATAARPPAEVAAA